MQDNNLKYSQSLVLKVQKQLNQILISDFPLKEDGIYNEETEKAIMMLQEITNYLPNGFIDQNLLFRLNEIIENPVITEHNKSRTFAVLYNKYINDREQAKEHTEVCKVISIKEKSYTIDFKGKELNIKTNGTIDKDLIPEYITVKYFSDIGKPNFKFTPIYE